MENVFIVILVLLFIAIFIAEQFQTINKRLSDVMEYIGLAMFILFIFCLSAFILGSEIRRGLETIASESKPVIFKVEQK